MPIFDETEGLLPPPRKAGWPILGNIEFVIGDKAKLVSSCNGTTSLSLLGQNMVIVQDPELCNRVYRLEGSHVVHGKILPSFDGVMGLKSMLNLRGIAHKNLRSSLLSCFHQSALLKHSHHFEEVAGSRLKTWAKMEVFDAVPEVEGLILEIGMGFVGIDPLSITQERRDQVKRDIRRVSDALLSLPVDLGEYSTYGRGMAARRRILAFSKAAMDQRRADIATRESNAPSETPEKDMIQYLLDARDANGFPLSEETLLDNMMSFLLGSVDTMWSTTTAFLLNMCRFPEIQELAHKHIWEVLDAEGVVQNNGDPLPTEIWKKLEYIDQIFLESMRYTPSTAFAAGRTAAKDFALGGHLITKGTKIIPDILTRSRSAKCWTNPNEFDPSRFDKSRPEYRKNVKKLGNFGGGVSICFGRGYAAHKFKVIATLLFRDFKIEFADPSAIPKIEYDLTSTLDGPLQIKLTPRRKL